MIVLYIGGQKSGKSKFAEQHTLNISHKKPYYIATYDDSYGDIQMQKKIDLHKKQRQNNFITINETIKLSKVIFAHHTYIVDCVSMWILNTINKKEKKLFKQLEKLYKLSNTTETNIVFVLNDVNSGIIPADKLSAKFVDRTGTIGQYIANMSDEVYEIKFGLKHRLK